MPTNSRRQQPESLRKINSKLTARGQVREVPPPEFPAHSGILVSALCNGGMGDLAIQSAFLDHFFRECGFPLIHAIIVDPLRIEEAQFVFHHSPSVQAVISQADVRPSSTPYDVILKMGDLLSCEFMREDRVRRFAPGLLEKLTAARQIQQRYCGFIDATPNFDGLFAYGA